MFKNIFALVYCLLITRTINAQCTNGGFESGNFSNWNGYTSINSNGNIDLAGQIPGFVTGQHDIVNSGFDPILGGSVLKKTLFGNAALRLGSSDILPNRKSQTVSYTFTVSSARPYISFSYSLVLQDPGTSHTYNQKPFFEYWLSKSSNISSSRCGVN